MRKKKKRKVLDVVDVQNFTTIDSPEEERLKLNVGEIYANQARCLGCDEVIRSRNCHDYVTCKCGNLSVDGGSWYLKRSVLDVTVGCKELSVHYSKRQKRS